MTTPSGETSQRASWLSIGAAGILPFWILFISTAVSLFARNVEEFHPNVSLFYGNIRLLVVCAASWFVISAVWRRWPWWAHVSAGLTVGVFLYVSALSTAYGEAHRVSWLAIALASVPGVAFALRTISVSALHRTLILGLLLIACADVWAYFRQPNGTAVLEPTPLSQVGDPSRALPNIYHFVFDGMQSDVFAEVVQHKETLFRGFTWFQNTASLTADTVNALASIFAVEDADSVLWMAPGWEDRRADFYREAHAGNGSLKQRLRSLGYAMEGHVFYPTQYPFFLEGFDRFLPHYAYVESYPTAIDDGGLFFDLWQTSILPPQLSAHLVPRISDLQLTGRAVLSSFPPLVSYGAVQKFLGAEYSRPSSGRYVFFHLLLPHKPFVFRSNCEPTHDQFNWDDTPNDDAVRGQYGCAGKTIADILETLRRLDRFDRSLIVIQSDHGDGFVRAASGKFERVIDPTKPDTFTRATLLLKPAGQTGAYPMRLSDFPATVSDVARTMLGQVDPHGGGSMKGVDLLNPPGGAVERRRFFYWEQEAETLRFLIDVNGRLQPPTVLPRR